jgi:3-oxoacyl-[acyl-carrier protein] reductase
LPGQAVYSATKGAINALTKVLAKELAGFGIQVNAVAPGFVNTDMLKALSDEKKEEYLTQIPLQRFGEPSEVADVVDFLCREEASYITGQVIIIDGGLSI